MLKVILTALLIEFTCVVVGRLISSLPARAKILHQYPPARTMLFQAALHLIRSMILRRQRPFI